MTIDFNFTEKYLQLQNNLFRTVRGVSRIKKYKKNQKVSLGFNGKFVKYGLIQQVEETAIHYLSVKQLAGYLNTKEFKIYDYNNAIQAINRTRRYGKIKSIEDKVSLFTIIKIN